MIQHLKAKKLLLIAIIFVAPLTFNNCDPVHNVGVIQQLDSSSIGEVKTGVQLYNNHCASCHLPLEISKIRGAKADKIGAAISSEPSMAHLANLSTIEITKIAEALSVVVPPPVSDGKKSDRAKPLVLNRHMLKSNLKEMFTADTGRDASDTNIDTVIDGLISTKSEAFGGNCSRYDAGCMQVASCGNGEPDCIALLDGHMQADPNPVFNTISQGYIVRTCEEVLAIDKATVTALSKIGLNTASAIDEANLMKITKYFLRERPVNAEAITQLLQQNSVAQSKNYVALDQWRFILLSLCISTSSTLL